MGERTTKTDISKADYQEAIEKLEALAAAGEALAEAGGEHSPELVALASRLLKVSESIAEAAEAAGDTGEGDADNGDEPNETHDSGTDDNGNADDTSSAAEDDPGIMASMRTTLDRVNTLLDNIDSKGETTPPEKSPPKPEPPNESQALSKDLKQVLDSVKKHQQRLARLEKQYGLPNSLPSGETRASPQDEGESWPRDLNAPVDRESIDKSVSFHDAPRRKGIR